MVLFITLLSLPGSSTACAIPTTVFLSITYVANQQGKAPQAHCSFFVSDGTIDVLLLLISSSLLRFLDLSILILLYLFHPIKRSRLQYPTGITCINNSSYQPSFLFRFISAVSPSSPLSSC